MDKDFFDYKISWYVLRVLYRHEFQVSKNLIKLGYHSMVPAELRSTRRSRRAKTRILRRFPLFPGYCFLGHTTRPIWRTITKEKNVLSFLMVENRPYRLSRTEAERIQRLCEEDTIVTPDNRLFLPGMLVKVTDGPLKEYKARIIKVKGDKAVIEIRMFGEHRNLEVDTYDLDLA